VSLPQPAATPFAEPRQSLLDEVRQIFADLTRYPLDILSPSADLEEELGIDSVKLGEIFSVLRERYALPPRAELRDRISADQLRTIAGVTDIVRSFGHSTERASSPSHAPSATPPSPDAPAQPASTAQPTIATTPTESRHTSSEVDDPKHLDGLEHLRAMLAGLVPRPPIASLLDFRLVEIERGRAVFEQRPASNQYNPMGLVHGGVAATVLDSAMGCAVLAMLPARATYITLDLTVNFVRPVREEVGRLVCEGKIVHAGASIATTEGRLMDEQGRLYAHATGTCLIRSEEAAS
jgi:uncharacterized protein (TIGR00369 family)